MAKERRSERGGQGLSRRRLLQAGVLGPLAACFGEEGVAAPGQAGPATRGSPEARRITVRASGHTVGQVLTAVNRLSPWKLAASPSVAAETVAIDFRGGTVPELMKGLETLFHYAWRREAAADGSLTYRLVQLPTTTNLEAALRRAPYVRGIMALRQEVIPQLVRLQKLKRPELRGAGDYWARFMITMIPAEEMESLFQTSWRAARVGELTPPQVDALWRCVTMTLKVNASDPRARERLAALTPESFRSMPIILRAKSRRLGGVVELHIPEVGMIPAVLRASELKIPQGVDPYVYFTKGAKPQTPAGKAAEIKLPDRDWAEAISLVREATGRDVFSDRYTVDPVRTPAGDYQASHWEELIGPLCERWGRFWWADERNLYVRDTMWYSAKLEEPSPSLRIRLENDIRGGQVRQGTLDELARAPVPQLHTILSRTLFSKWVPDVDPFSDFLTVYAAGLPAQRTALLAAGLRLDQLSRAQVDVIGQLPPDSALRLAAEAQPQAFLLQLRQFTQEPSVAFSGRGAALILSIRYGGERSSRLEFTVPEKEAERTWKVALAE